MSEVISWSDRLGNRKRVPFLLLRKDNDLMMFSGKDIPGICVITKRDYEKCGIYSCNKFQIELASGVISLPKMQGWETGGILEGLNIERETWECVANSFGVSVPSVQRFFREHFPKTANALDETEKNLSLLSESSPEEIVYVTISWGNYSKRRWENGDWFNPKPIPGFPECFIELIDKSKGWGYLDNIKITGINGVVISTVHSKGMGGGYFDIKVSVSPGSEEQNPFPESRLENLLRNVLSS